MIRISGSLCRLEPYRSVAEVCRQDIQRSFEGSARISSFHTLSFSPPQGFLRACGTGQYLPSSMCPSSTRIVWSATLLLSSRCTLCISSPHRRSDHTSPFQKPSERVVQRHSGST